MDDLCKILFQHRDSYPLMTFNDYLKLIYQNTFGPRHFVESPDRNRIIDEIKKETKLYKDGSRQGVVDIGFGYVKVDLTLIKENKLTVEELGQAFIRSGENPLTRDNYLVFRERTVALLRLVEEGSIPVSVINARKTMTTIDFENPTPISHSLQYRKAYKPHYRVVKTENLPKIQSIR